jgi:CRISPR-associated protein Cas1
MAKQAAVSLPTRKRIWKQIVQAKIRAQARALVEIRGADLGLGALADRVRAGDPQNLEAQAAVRYWKMIFGRTDFRRRPDAPDENRFLNYGYTVLRAMVARAVCAAGLHPSLGLHHHNRYDAYQLADDLMEPFRPIVDRAVVRLSDELGSSAEMGGQVKGKIVGALTSRYLVDEEWRTVTDLIQRTAFRLCAVFSGRVRDLEIRVP